MITVTKIKQVKSDIYELIIQNNTETEKFFVLGTTLADLQLLKPQAIEITQYEELRQKNTFYQAYQKGLYYLSFRPRAKKEMVSYLMNKHQFSATICQQVINKLVKQGYINDEVFIKSYLQDAIINKKYGPKRIYQMLMQKTDNPKLSQHYLDFFYTDKVCQEKIQHIIKRLAKKKYASQTAFSKDVQNKLISYGFSLESISNLVLPVVTINYEKYEVKAKRIFQQALKKGKTQFEAKQKTNAYLQAKHLEFDVRKALINTIIGEDESEG